MLSRGVELLNENLKYDGKVIIVIGDDSDNDDLAFEPGISILSSKGQHEVIATRHNPRKGLGANLNWLLQNCGADYAIQMDDDHWLMKPLDITPHVKKLESDPSAGAIRLMGIAGHKYRATLEETYWRIDWTCDELYIASNRPHLKVISRFHGEYGYYRENAKLGETEEAFCHVAIDTARMKLNHGLKTLDVLIPLDALTESGWDHVGDSWQLKGF